MICNPVVIDWLVAGLVCTNFCWIIAWGTSITCALYTLKNGTHANSAFIEHSVKVRPDYYIFYLPMISSTLPVFLSTCIWLMCIGGWPKTCNAKFSYLFLHSIAVLEDMAEPMLWPLNTFIFTIAQAVYPVFLHCNGITSYVTHFAC